jgi:UDP:flavonoid glycosyltransferase YjiC (YdhE family)
LGARVIVAAVYPVMYFPTAAFANPYQPAIQSPPTAAAIRRTWRLAIPALTADDRVIQEWRERTLGLPPRAWRADLRRLRRLPHLLGYSGTVLPRPGDWPSNAGVTGYWTHRDDVDVDPSAALERFLAAGPPPIVVGFSSQVGGDRAALTRAAVDGLAKAGARGILLTGFGGLRAVEPAPHVFAAADAPHGWLFARAAGVIHHGGSGTTGAALRAGLPNAAIPFGYDQPLWAARIHALGAGPAPLDHRTLDADIVARTIDALLSDRAMRARAEDIGERLRAEDGVRVAVLRVLELLRL